MARETTSVIAPRKDDEAKEDVDTPGRGIHPRPAPNRSKAHRILCGEESTTSTFASQHAPLDIDSVLGKCHELTILSSGDRQGKPSRIEVSSDYNWDVDKLNTGESVLKYQEVCALLLPADLMRRAMTE